MKRFIRYLYEYEQGKRTRNVGFVKVEQDDYECTVHVHGKGLRMNGEKLGLYLFYEEDGMCVGIRQGEIDNINPAVNCCLHYTREDVGEAENFPRINGVIMSNGSGRKYASVWDDTIEADVDRMRLWTEKPEPENRREEEAEEMENLREEEAEEMENLPGKRKLRRWKTSGKRKLRRWKTSKKKQRNRKVVGRKALRKAKNRNGKGNFKFRRKQIVGKKIKSVRPLVSAVK